MLIGLALASCGKKPDRTESTIYTKEADILAIYEGTNIATGLKAPLYLTNKRDSIYKNGDTVWVQMGMSYNIITHHTWPKTQNGKNPNYALFVIHELEGQGDE